MRFLRSLAVVAAAAVAGCAATVPPPLTPEKRAAYRVEHVEVVVAEDAAIWWGAGERQLAEAAGISTDDAQSVAEWLETPEGKEALRALLRDRVAAGMQRKLVGALGGTRPAQLTVLIEGVHVSSAAQQILVGGHHAIGGGVQLYDLETGEALTGPQRMIGMGTGGGGIVGAIVDGLRDDPLDRTVESFGHFTRAWLIATEPVEVPLTEEANARPLPPIPGPEPEPALVPESAGAEAGS